MVVLREEGGRGRWLCRDSGMGEVVVDKETTDFGE